MRFFLAELQKRNFLLFWYGSFNFLVAFFCLGLMLSDNTRILGVNAWEKPFGFYISGGIMAWSIAWMIYHINSKNIRLICSWLIAISTFVENGIVFFQSYKGVPSHFNVSNPFNSLLYSLICLCIVVFLFAVLLLTIVFFRQRKMPISQHYSWGIRMGFLIFVTTSIIGALLMGISTLTIDGSKGIEGIKFLYWDTKFNDLRAARFMSVYSLQIIPIISYYMFEKKRQVINFSITYIIAIFIFVLLAFLGIPIFPTK